MTWVLLAIIASQNPTLTVARFPNKVSCDADRLWIEANAHEKIKTVCLQDIEEFPEDKPAPPASEAPSEPMGGAQ